LFVIRKKPVNFDSEDTNYFQNEFQRQLQPGQVFEMKNLLLCSDGVLFQANLQVFKPSLIHESLTSVHTPFSFLTRLLKSGVKILPFKNRYGVLFDGWSHGYFHWLTEVLPKILRERDAIKSLVLLFPKRYSNGFFSDSLKLLNITNVEYYDENRILFLKNATLITGIKPAGNYDEKEIGSLRSLFIKKYTAKPFRRIYISRAKAGRRKVANENELISLLNKYHFEIVFAEDLPFDRQVQMMAETQYLISIHGAGLTNMLFMHPHTHVLEFKLKDDYANLCYFSLASALAINYYYLVCSAHSGTESITSDYLVSVHELEHVIQNMLTHG
jgi:capsular polysaccharide biosynthesis protein